jgi:hypothetical protein
MQLELSPADAEFRSRMREFFTTKVPQEIRDTVLEGRHLTRDQIVEAQQTLTPRASPFRTGRSSGAARTGPSSSGTSGTRRCSVPACRSRWRSTRP